LGWKRPGVSFKREFKKTRVIFNATYHG
jgi:hypothetical protein